MAPTMTMAMSFTSLLRTTGTRALSGLGARVERALRATTRAEREAIYRFRYTIYASELGRVTGGVDHARKQIRDPDDEADFTTHFYVGSPDCVLAASRVRAWAPGQVPARDFETFSLALFPNIAQLSVCEIGRYMVRPSMRGKLMLASLASAGFDFVAGEQKMDLALGSCRPGLVEYYRKIGARPYGGRMIDGPDGLEIPLVGVISDEEHYLRVGAPQAAMVRRHFGPGKRAPLDARPFAHLFAENARSVVTDPAEVWRELGETLLRAPQCPPAIFASLDARALRTLCSNAFILSAPSGSVVTREGRRERELFVVIDGELEAGTDTRSGRRDLARLLPGDVFGEIAFLSERGERSATVSAKTASRLLVLRRSFLDRLAARDRRAAMTVLHNLGRLVSERLALTSKAP
jgi:CRP-like cAMP-binding protein